MSLSIVAKTKFIRHDRWVLTRATIVCGALLAEVLLVAASRSLVLAALLAFAFFAVASYFQPLPAMLLALLLSTNVLKFVDLSFLPHLQLAPGARLNGQDIVVGMLFALGALRLHRRGERPLFLRPLLLLLGMVAISFVLGAIAGTTDADVGLNGLRDLSGYLFYIGLVGLIDSPRKLHSAIWLVFILAIASVSVQLVEASLGHRLTTPTTVASGYWAGTKTVEVGGLTAPYLWNRATGYLLVGLFLALGGALWSKSPRHAILAALASLGFVLALMREWYLMITLGVLVILILPRKGRPQALLGLAAVALLLAGAIRVLASTGLLSSYPLVDVWVGRLGTVANFQQEQNFLVRIDTWREQLDWFRQAPLFGYGPGSVSRLPLSGTLDWTDTGLPNTLVQYGLFGSTAVALVIVTFFRRGYVLFRGLPAPRARGYAAGLLGAWVAIVAGYSFGFDFFTWGELTFAVGLAMALLDRLGAFASGAVETT